jgi:hypothetical protein
MHGVNSPSAQNATIRAELAWSDTATALGLIVQGSSPVLTLCRKLIARGHDPATPLEAWRGGTLCLRIRSISEAAALQVGSHGVGFKYAPAWEAGPPMRGKGCGHG